MALFLIKNNRGFSLPIVLGIIGLLAGLALGYLATVRSELSTTQAFYEGTKAGYYAECGARAAVSKLAYDAAYRTATNRTRIAALLDPLTGSSYSVICYNPTYSASSDTYQRKIESTGNNSAYASRTLTLSPVTLSPPMIGLGKYALFTGGNMTVSNNVIVTGSLASNGTITLGNGASVSDGIFPNYGFTGLAGILPSATSLLPYTDRETYSEASPALPAPPTVSGAMSVGSYYSSGDWTVPNNAIITTSEVVTIFVNGNVIFGNTCYLTGTSPGSFAILATGTVTFGNNDVLTKALVVCGGVFSLNNNAALSGAIVCGGEAAVNNNGFGFDESTYSNYSALFNYQIIDVSTKWTVTVGGYN
ncbi:MAG: hypothetical protein WCV63_06305 [Negativicutes bacterium]|jgi:hypothetical protein